MMIFTIVYWVSLNSSVIALLCWTVLKIRNRRFFYPFSAFIFSGGIYINLLLLKWQTSYGEANPSLLAKLIFAVTPVMVVTCDFFFTAFTDDTKRPPSRFSRFLKIVLIGFIPLSLFTNLIVRDDVVSAGTPKFIIEYGILHRPFILLILGAFSYSLLIFWRSCRLCTNQSQKYQMRLILKAILVVSGCLVTTNGIFPALTGKSDYSVYGAFIPSLFFSAIIFIIVKGEAIWLKSIFSEILKADITLCAENQRALRGVIDTLRVIMAKGPRQIHRLFRFKDVNGKTIKIVLQHGQTSFPMAEDNELGKTMLLESLGKYLLQLEAENRRLVLANVRAESVLQEHWIAREIEKVPEYPLHLLPSGSEMYKEVAESVLAFERHWRERIVCADAESFRLMQKLEKRKDISHPLLIGGESATGKATLCRCLHNLRSEKNLVEFSAKETSLQKIQDSIEALRMQKDTASGVLIRHIQDLDNRGLKYIWLLLNNPPGNLHLYFTASEDFLSKINHPALAAILSLIYMQSIPLRRRREDIKFLALYFAATISQRIGKQAPIFSTQAMHELFAHEWPGNISQLRVAIEMTVSENYKSAIEHITVKSLLYGLSDEPKTLTPLEEAEKRAIQKALIRNEFNKSQTGRELGISLNTLKSRIDKYCLKAPENFPQKTEF